MSGKRILYATMTEMQIGPHKLRTLCRLAPMAGISNIPFRFICKELGSSLTTSEEISAKGLLYESKRSFEIADYISEEKPIAMQIFGAEANYLADAAKWLADRGADIIDLNMGCPVPKITKTGAGAALLKDPEKCARIFKAIRKAIDIPFTIKVRGGWDEANINAPEIAQIAEAEGVNAITVHPRTRMQKYSGIAPWEVIRMVVNAVNIPVTGNGDVKSYADAYRMQKETGCKSVMIGRAALGQPWIFSQEYETLSQLEKFSFQQKVIRRHFSLIKKHMKEAFAIIQMKKHLAWYCSGMNGASKARAEVFRLTSIAAVEDLFEQHWENLIELENNKMPAKFLHSSQTRQNNTYT